MKIIILDFIKLKITTKCQFINQKSFFAKFLIAFYNKFDIFVQ